MLNNTVLPVVMPRDVGSSGRFLAPQWGALCFHAAAPGFGAVAHSLLQLKNGGWTTTPNNV